MGCVNRRTRSRMCVDLSQALPWQAVCNPAVHVARHGFPGMYKIQSLSYYSLTSVQVTEDLVRYMNFSISIGDNFLVDDPQWAIDFAPNGW